jgi:Mn2+/Fe2+ NRAMP family transporter
MTMEQHATAHPNRTLMQVIGPGILVAATGVGAADLAGGALAGQRLGVAALWMVLFGATLKFVLCEGLARWQLTSGLTLPEGAAALYGRWYRPLFLAYLFVWSFCICGMLMSACGATAQAILPLGANSTGRVIYGVLHSFVAVFLVRLGGFRLFERMMAVCIGVMFFTVVFAAAFCLDSVPEALRGLLIPSIPDWRGNGIAWAVTLLAGVGGTVTMLCYGYWIREKGRMDSSSLPECRIDLATGYLMTAVFGMAMVILGAGLGSPGSESGNVNLIMSLSNQINDRIGGGIGSVAGWMFRVGAWGAVFSSLLGVWQSIPLLILDVVSGQFGTAGQATIDYRSHRTASRLLLAIAILPMCNLFYPLATVQLIAGLAGAIFLPAFAGTLLALSWRGLSGFRNGRFATLILWFCMLLFAYCMVLRLQVMFE